MEVIVYSGTSERELLLKRMTDRVIMQNRMRLMSLHTASPRSAEELAELIKQGRGYLVIMDADRCPDWKGVIAEISEQYRQVSFCIVSDSAAKAVEAVNMGSVVCGYADVSAGKPEVCLEKTLSDIYSKVSTVCGGIMTYGSDGSLKVISFSDIYYIETIKQQHRCTIYHKNGTDTMRADISRLIRRLDGRFEITRSSTIANLSAVKKIEDGLMFFSSDIFCSVTGRRLGEIKKIMDSQRIML